MNRYERFNPLEDGRQTEEWETIVLSKSIGCRRRFALLFFFDIR